MNVILFDDQSRNELLPLTYTRPVADIRIGILTIREKWERYLNLTTSSLTDEYLSKKYSLKIATKNLLINGAVCPNSDLVAEILKLESNQKLVDGDQLIAAKVDGDILNDMMKNKLPVWKIDVIKVSTQYKYLKINNLWDIFQKNGDAFLEDYNYLTQDRESKPLSKTNQVLGKDIFIEEGARIECAVLNSTTGPIYIGRYAEIMEGSVIRGPFALGEHSILKLSSKIYGPTTIGPHCRVGGEVNNSVLLGYSNKGHDGFLGNSVLGEWCNLGADTNTSNLKNNYGNIKVWNYPHKSYVNSGQQFCGMIMGDHSKCGINTMFNTGTVVGVFANVFGAAFPKKFVPSFAWGSSEEMGTYELEKALDVANCVMERRNVELRLVDRDILEHVFNTEKEFRN